MTIPRETKSSHGALPYPKQITRDNLSRDHTPLVHTRNPAWTMSSKDSIFTNGTVHPSYAKIIIARDYTSERTRHGYSTSSLE
jgi:hypothetical protein